MRPAITGDDRGGNVGYGDELAGYGDLAALGAVVVKSLAAFAWEGNEPPRVAASGPHMINSVGLAGPGSTRGAPSRPRASSLRRDGRRLDWEHRVEFAAAARAMGGGPLAALEVNVSCPNLEDRSGCSRISSPRPPTSCRRR